MRGPGVFEKRNVYTTDHFVMDDAYIDHYAKVCGPYATAVYLALCRYADMTTQSCSPSVSLMARKLGISTRQITRALKPLEWYNIIWIERTPGDVNTYWLIDRKHWKPASVRQALVPDGQVTTRQCLSDTAPPTIGHMTGVYQTPDP